MITNHLFKISYGEYMGIKKAKTFTVKVLACNNVSPSGFEPETASLEGRCSIQLSYEPINSKKKGMISHPHWSGWQDSNLRPPRPKRGAMTGLRYTPSICY